MNCIIVDDEESARIIIKQLCNSVKGLTVLEEFSNGIDAIKYLTKNEVDVVFLDIQMPNFTGFDVIESIAHPPKIILTTSDSNFALDAFSYDSIVDYLVKPISSARFQLSIDKLKKILEIETSSNNATKMELLKDEEHLFVNVDKRLIKISVSDIEIVKADGDYVLIICHKASYKVHSTLSNTINKLPSDLFLRIHRSYVINFTKIIDIEDNTLLINKRVVPIGRTYRKDLVKRLNLL
jgi:DNA-binding LytR/AlgR family response regulator